MVRRFVTAAVVTAALAVLTAPADAQVLGSFSWRLAPYCNVITVTVTQSGSNYTLDGYDNQCGGSTRAAVTGMAVPNPTGTVTLGFTIVTPPSATPVHVQTAIDLASLGGSWTDDQGNGGTFVFTPSGVGSGSPRPAALLGLPDNAVTSSKIADGAVGGSDIDPAQVQKRVTSVCPTGQLMTGVTETGGVVCQAVTSSSGGDITGVNPGTGLTGGGASGEVTLGLASSGVTAAYLAPNAVDASKILDGAIGAADINQSQVQARVVGSCPSGQAMRTVAQNGGVTCEPVTGGAGGDITSVTAVGPHLSGGGTSGDVSISVNLSQVQARVSVGCPANQSMQSISADGTPVCDVDNDSGGDITAVNTGPGLIGGQQSGAPTLAVTFGGTGALDTVARSDHNHAIGSSTSSNTGVGPGALSRVSSGTGNTAIGNVALTNNTDGRGNTAVGAGAMSIAVSSVNNTAIGSYALAIGGTGNTAVGFLAHNSGGPGDLENTAVGYTTLQDAEGDGNTALGALALKDLSVGDGNVALGRSAGINLTSGSNNLYLGSRGGATESGNIRIGDEAVHSRTFVAGVVNVTTGANNAVPVLVDARGQLGTTSSSRKTKFDIADLPGSVSTALQRLRPVQFRYKQTYSDGSTPIQYGLIAEEVEQVLPALVAYDEHDQPMTVKYHVLPGLLLAEVQRLERERTAQDATVAALRAEVAALRGLVDALMVAQR